MNDEDNFISSLLVELLQCKLHVNEDKYLELTDCASAHADAEMMVRIIDGIRAQILSITEASRMWKRRNGDLSDPLSRRYSAVEGILVNHDLRQHWIFYRYAQRDHARYRQCHERLARIPLQTADSP